MPLTRLSFAEGASDTELFSATPDTVYSSENGGGTVLRIDIGTVAGKGSGIHRGIWTFPLSANGITSIDRAIFRTYCDTVLFSQASPCELVRITETGLVVTEATWNSYATGNAWSVAGGDYTETNKATFTGPTSPGWVVIDVTAMAQDALAGDGVLRMLGKLVTEDTGEDDRFRVWQMDDGDIFPELVIGHADPSAITLSEAGMAMGFDE